MDDAEKARRERESRIRSGKYAVSGCRGEGSGLGASNSTGPGKGRWWAYFYQTEEGPFKQDLDACAAAGITPEELGTTADELAQFAAHARQWMIDRARDHLSIYRQALRDADRGGFDMPRFPHSHGVEIIYGYLDQALRLGISAAELETTEVELARIAKRRILWRARFEIRSTEGGEDIDGPYPARPLDRGTIRTHIIAALLAGFSMGELGLPERLRAQVEAEYAKAIEVKREVQAPPPKASAPPVAAPA